jgi:hypothetical protein
MERPAAAEAAVNKKGLLIAALKHCATQKRTSAGFFRKL